MYVRTRRKLVQAGGSLAVTLPAEVVQAFKLKKGAEIDVTVHPQTGAVTIRPGVRFFEGGKVTPQFRKLAAELLERRVRVYRKLAR
jgi:antitoxin component of MazEF toxin-antitoxin module